MAQRIWHLWQPSITQFHPGSVNRLFPLLLSCSDVPLHPWEGVLPGWCLQLSHCAHLSHKEENNGQEHLPLSTISILMLLGTGGTLLDRHHQHLLPWIAVQRIPLYRQKKKENKKGWCFWIISQEKQWFNVRKAWLNSFNSVDPDCKDTLLLHL